MTNKSGVARLRQHIAQHDEAAQRALYAPAIVARHEAITKRMEQGAAHILHLIEQGKRAEAVALMDQENWGVTESEATHG